jgi:hypothetical protein
MSVKSSDKLGIAGYGLYLVNMSINSYVLLLPTN